MYTRAIAPVLRKSPYFHLEFSNCRSTKVNLREMQIEIMYFNKTCFSGFYDTSFILFIIMFRLDASRELFVFWLDDLTFTELVILNYALLFAYEIFTADCWLCSLSNKCPIRFRIPLIWNEEFFTQIHKSSWTRIRMEQNWIELKIIKFPRASL